MPTEFRFNEVFTHVIGEIAKSVCERSGETAQQQFARSHAAMHMIMGFVPRDIIEALLGGHCVMLHETMLASVHDTLLGEADSVRPGTRSTLVAMNKEFNSNLNLMARYQSRPVLARRDAPSPPTEARPAGPKPRAAPEAPMPSGEMPAAPNQTAQAEALRSKVQEEPDSVVENDPEAGMEYRPSPVVLAECQDNPGAMAALAAGDPERFAKALGITMPGEAFLEAASTPGSPFDPNAMGPWPASAAGWRRKA